MDKDNSNEAKCRPGMNPRSTDYKKCALQAYADAIDAVKICHLPLAPQRPLKNLLDFYEYQFKNESSPLECAQAELKAKPKTYHVRPFNFSEETEILYTGHQRAATEGRNGARRSRSFLGL